MQYQTYMQPAATSMPMPFQTMGQNGSMPYQTMAMPGATQGLPNFTSQPTFTSQNIGAFAQPQTFQTQPFASAQFMTPPSLSAPLTPKIVQSPIVDMGGATAKVIASALGTATQKSNMQSMSSPVTKTAISAREQALEARARELESILASKDRQIQELQVELANVKPNSGQAGKRVSQSPGRKSGSRNMSESKPSMNYSPGDPDDSIDVRLAEFYNSTGSAIQFKRINRGFYRFGETIVELDIVNHKLMARTEDGWNRGKLAPVEKFMTQYENIEREKMGILLDN
jgi:hypothetical protein